MKKARLGFKIYSLADELLVEEAEDFVWRAEDRKVRARRNQLASKRACYHRNNEKYNAARTAANKEVGRRYRKARANAAYRSELWHMNQEEWEALWVDAGYVSIPGTRRPERPHGEVRTAYALRGSGLDDNTSMVRVDSHEPWSESNCYILYRGEPLIGSANHRHTNPYFVD